MITGSRELYKSCIITLIKNGVLFQKLHFNCCDLHSFYNFTSGSMEISIYFHKFQVAQPRSRSFSAAMLSNGVEIAIIYFRKFQHRWYQEAIVIATGVGELKSRSISICSMWCGGNCSRASSVIYFFIIS